MALAVLLRVHQFFGFSPGGLVYAPARYGRFEPVEELSCRVDLVVVLAPREDRHLVEVFGKPGRCFGEATGHLVPDGLEPKGKNIRFPNRSAPVSIQQSRLP